MAKPKAPDSKTLAARQMFLYGEGDGVRITSIPELSAKSGVTQLTLRKWLPTWNEELEETLRKTTKLASPTILSLSHEILEDHKADISFFRTNLDILKAEHDSLDTALDEMLQFCRNFEGDEAKFDQFIKIFDRYCRLSMNKKGLMSQIMKIKELWDSKSGVDSLKSVQEATAKAISVASAKSAPDEDGSDAPRVVSGDVFRKRL